MKSYFNKLITGYSLEKKEVNGQKYLFKYRGKLTFFDPVLMIQECRYRATDSKVQTYEMIGSCSDIQKLLPKPPQASKPSVICEFKKDDQKWLVSRFALKNENRSVSHYRFEVDGEFIGGLYRIYDNGNNMLNHALKIASAQGTTLSLSAEKLIWKSKTGEEVFVEKFGHTQIWVWTQPVLELVSLEK
ncbi:hypothetical protein [Algoriphagus mannitolivorans]|uniref:hypothetical protein n=1 Tax=Algoriphagus mannitolivorans TaxID=226504 RepID=UPI0004052971|nr:hypothetical protein [Algoriphagus mannitolivorans]